MRLSKNNACIQIGLDEFLEFLEEETLDDLLHTLNQMDEGVPLSELRADFDGDILSFDDFEGMNEEEFYALETMTEEEFLQMIERADPELLDEIMMSNEDIKVRNIVRAFSFIEHQEK